LDAGRRGFLTRHGAAWSTTTKLLLYTFAYCMLAHFSLMLTTEGNPASPIWPSSGVALAAVLLLGYRAGVVALVGGIWVTLVRDFVLLPALLSGLGALAEAWAAAWLLRWLGFDSRISNLRDVWMLLLVSMLAAVLSPAIGLTAYAEAGIIRSEYYSEAWYAWWLGDTLGVMVFAPLLLSWSRRLPDLRPWTRAAQLLLVYLLTVAIAATIFGPFLPLRLFTHEAEFLLYPLLIWTSLRYRLSEVAGLLPLLALVASYGTVQGHGPFLGPNALDSLALFLIAASVIVLAFSASAAALKRSHREQLQLNELLTGLVEAIPDAIFYKDGAGRWLLTNEAAKRLFRLHGHDWRGKTDRQLGQERPAMRAMHEGCIAGDEEAWAKGKECLITEMLADADGLEREFEVIKAPMFHADGRRKGMVIVGRDVTGRRRLERGLVKATEYQQRSVGQELHDNLGQRLTGIAFLCKALEQSCRDKGLPEAEQLAGVVVSVNEAIAETKNLARGLMPVELEANGLAAALDELCARTAATFGIRCRLDCEGDVMLRDRGLSLNLYRIAQEAISNAIRHGRATDIAVRLAKHAAHLRLTVTDNGRGLEGKGPEHATGMGLDIMQYRASLIRGDLRIAQRAAGGVEVEVRVDQAY